MAPTPLELSQTPYRPIDQETKRKRGRAGDPAVLEVVRKPSGSVRVQRKLPPPVQARVSTLDTSNALAHRPRMPQQGVRGRQGLARR